eukprot:1012325_1
MARLPSVPVMIICSVVTLLYLSGVWFILWTEGTSDSKANEVASVVARPEPVEVAVQKLADMESDPSSYIATPEKLVIGGRLICRHTGTDEEVVLGSIPCKGGEIKLEKCYKWPVKEDACWYVRP